MHMRHSRTQRSDRYMTRWIDGLSATDNSKRNLTNRISALYCRDHFQVYPCNVNPSVWLDVWLRLVLVQFGEEGLKQGGPGGPGGHPGGFQFHVSSKLVKPATEHTQHCQRVIAGQKQLHGCCYCDLLVQSTQWTSCSCLTSCIQFIWPMQ